MYKGSEPKPNEDPVSHSLRVPELPCGASKGPTRLEQIPHPTHVAPRPTGTQRRLTASSAAAPMLLPQLRLPSGPRGAGSGAERLCGLAFGMLGARPGRSAQHPGAGGRRGLPWEGMVCRTSRCKNTKSKTSSARNLQLKKTQKTERNQKKTNNIDCEIVFRITNNTAFNKNNLNSFMNPFYFKSLFYCLLMLQFSSSTFIETTNNLLRENDQSQLSFSLCMTRFIQVSAFLAYCLHKAERNGQREITLDK